MTEESTACHWCNRVYLFGDPLIRNEFRFAVPELRSVR